ncbi:Alpha-hemolysin translocation ATP-binding protein HlyB [Planctomycetes bacterium MalM25]|nr:Alpha-hemolysin translocation ATP-binding protein HlyB [Planctomycetes bacterium MalM25]
MSSSTADLDSSIATLPLPAAVVRLGHESGVAVERLRAEQSLRDAESTWPGQVADRWSDWMSRALESVSLRCRLFELSLDEATQLAADGAKLVGCDQSGERVAVLVGAERGVAAFATNEIDGVQKVTLRSLASDGIDAGESRTWIMLDRPQMSGSVLGEGLARKPVRRFLRLLRPEWSDIGIILTFAFFAGLLSLATPIAVEALVNTVAFGRMLQPVVVLAALLFGFLAFAGVMQGVQTFVVEIIQRRLFARVAGDLAYRLPRVEASGWSGAYGPELVNRFLDVVTLQKVTAQLLTDGIGIVLATIVGMTVLAFYHPWLLGFDVLLLLLVVSGLIVLGRGAIPAAIKESKLKYGLVAWFEDIARCQNGFKSSGGAAFANDRASQLTSRYLAHRQDHFDVFFRQLVFVLTLQAIAGTVLLGGGGWLVIQGQLTLGQLVAAELIVATILSSLAKLGKHLDGFYDVVAAVDKLGALFDLPTERADGLLTLPEGRGARVRFAGVTHPHGGKSLQSGVTHAAEPCDRLAVLGPSGSGKTTIMRILYGLERPTSGHVEIEHADPRDLRPEVLREHVALAAEPELFEGTLAENVHLHRPGVTSNDVRGALFSVGLLDAALRFPDGLETGLNASGNPLSLTQQRLLMIARAMAGAPRLLLVDGVLDGLPDDGLRRVLDSLTDPKQPWTLVVTTGRASIAESVGRFVTLDPQESKAPAPLGAEDSP